MPLAEFGHHVGKNGQQITGDHPPGPVAADKKIRGQAVEIDAQAGRVPGSQALGQETADEAGEHIAGAAAGQGRVAGGIDAHPASGAATTVWAPFSTTSDPEPARFQGQVQAPGLHFRVVSPSSRAISPGWGVRIRGPAAPFKQAVSAGQVVDAVGVDDHGAGKVVHQPADQFPGFRMGAQSRAQGQGGFFGPGTPAWLQGPCPRPGPLPPRAEAGSWPR